MRETVLEELKLMIGGSGEGAAGKCQKAGDTAPEKDTPKGKEINLDWLRKEGKNMREK